MKYNSIVLNTRIPTFTIMSDLRELSGELRGELRGELQGYGLNLDIIDIIQGYVSKMNHADVLDELKEDQKNFTEDIINYAEDIADTISITRIRNIAYNQDDDDRGWNFPFSIEEKFEGDLIFHDNNEIPFWWFRKNTAIEIYIDMLEHYDYDALRAKDRIIVGILNRNGLKYTRSIEGWVIGYGVRYKNSFVNIRLIGEN